MIPSELQQSPGFLLNQSARLISRRLTEALEPLGLTLQNFGLLRVISLQGPLTQNQVAENYSMDRTTVTELVDGLEERGLVQRLKNPNDRRSNQLFMTPQGRRVLTRAIRVVEKSNRQFLSVLDDSEWETVRASLLKLIENADSRGVGSN
ncbi:MAG: MarR family transcriptional regulator [Candidatus Obscuribacterales bacterium]|nr:MarR family transcriptional regulator [Candidatus Obscuribacterales bacterium]